MTGEEFLFLQHAGRSADCAEKNDNCSQMQMAEKPTKHFEYGIRGIAKVFGCSVPTANRIKKSGKINAAITQIGRKIIVDADLALQLAGKKGGK